ncbi:glycosyltransferase family 4 protein [Candidatus Altiarchaeota archaeon]
MVARAFNGNNQTIFHLGYNLAKLFPEDISVRVTGLVNYNNITLKPLENFSVDYFGHGFGVGTKKSGSNNRISIIQVPDPRLIYSFLMASSKKRIYAKYDLGEDWAFSDINPLFKAGKYVLNKMLGRSCDLFFAHTNYATEKLTQDWIKPAFTVSHGFYPEMMGEAMKRSKQIIERLEITQEIEDKKVILWLGDTKRRSCFRLLEESLPKIFRENEDAVLMVVGGDYVSSDDRIVTLPRIKYEDALSLYSIANVVVLPKYDNPLQRWCIHIVKLVEALGAGVPVVTPNVCLASELPDDILQKIKPDSSDAISTAVNELFSSHNYAITLGKNAKKYAEKNLTWEARAKKMWELLLEI